MRQKPPKLAHFTAKSTKTRESFFRYRNIFLIPQGIALLAFCVAAQCAHFDTVAVAEPVEITAKKIMGNTRTAHGANRVWRGEPAHVVGAYTLDIQEEEHGLHKTAGCGAERCRRKLRGGMPAAEPWEFF